MNCSITASIRRQILFHEIQKNGTLKWTLYLQEGTAFTPNFICQKSITVQVSNLPSELQLRERQTPYFSMVLLCISYWSGPIDVFKENFIGRLNPAQGILQHSAKY